MIKIKDIAELAKVSPATVSRILSGDPTLSVRAETKQTVIDAADELGYVRKTIKKKKMLHYAIVQWISYSEEENDLYYYSVRRSIENYCIQSDIGSTKFYKENFDDLLKRTTIDGVICIGKFTNEQVEKLTSFTEHIIFVDSNPHSTKYSFVEHNLKEATNNVLDYLIDMGHTRIGFIGGHESTDDIEYLYSDVREYTFIKEKERRSLTTLDSDLYFGKFDSITGYNFIKEASKKDSLPSAFICASDSIAIGALSAVSELNLDLSIISFNNITTAKFLNPSLTTVDLNTTYMGEVAVHMMNYLIKSNTSQVFGMYISTELIIRNSVKDIS